LRSRYSGPLPSRPEEIDPERWRIFTEYFYEGLTLREVARGSGLSLVQVSHLLHEVDVELGPARGAGWERKKISQDSLIEDLVLSVRARNALRSLGCRTVQDLLRLDLLGPMRGIGSKTRIEVLGALRGSGLPVPEWDGPPDEEIRSIHRSLERMHGKVAAALGAVSREIATVQKRLHKKWASRSGATRGRVTPAEGADLPGSAR
jgi:hypothetical protein